jgi:hypothetical protein
MSAQADGAALAAGAQHRAAPPAAGLVISRIPAHCDRRMVTLEVGFRDIRVRRSMGYSDRKNHRGGRRNAISSFSNESRRRLLYVVRNFPPAPFFLTLTYPSEFPMDGPTVKRHWKRVRQWLQRQGASYGLWALEFQQRGASHIHVFINIWVDCQKLSEAWYRIVGSNDPKHLQAGTNICLFRKPSVMGSYLLKYVAKSQQKNVPAAFLNVGRFWGTWGNPTISNTVRMPLSEAKQLLRTIRRAYLKRRQGWERKGRFRDNGVSGFIAWESAYPVRRLLGDLTSSLSRLAKTKCLFGLA